MDMNELFKRAQEMQAKAAQMQQAMAEIEVSGQSGGGLVQATLSGKGELKKLRIDPALAKPEEMDVLEDLVVAAHADAKKRLEARLAEEMARLGAQLGLPPGLGLG